MKKLVLALTAVAALTTSASAADLGARPYAKAPVPYTPVYSWTGFYIFGGGGGGLWNADSNIESTGVVGPWVLLDLPALRYLAINGWAAAAGSER